MSAFHVSRRYSGLRWARPTIGAGAALIGLVIVTTTSWAAASQGGSLKRLAVPEPPNLAEFVQDRATATRLGKAFFWDMQVGSDGVQACASCHFQAGADTRTKGEVHPGSAGFTTGGGPNSALQASDFPFHKLADPGNRASAVLSDSPDIAGSHGVFKADFVRVVEGSSAEQCTHKDDAVFSIGGVNTRQVTGRNTPSNINAVFNFRNFWDGRANNVFNGVNPFGPNDPNARVWKLVNGQPQQVTIAIPNASAASQADGPALSSVEMSCAGRTWADLGHKLVNLTPLGKQQVDPNDSQLGSLAQAGKGLKVSYTDLIRAAFRPEWTSAAPVPVTVNGKQVSQLEANFSLFWGLAIQAYESTLVSDDAPFDRFVEGDNSAMTQQQQEGLAVFQGQGRCAKCHSGPLFTSAGSGANNGFAGFFNTGVSPTSRDAGAQPIANNPKVAGAFKTPTLRNVELNGPYFHNGDQATLREVVDFYNRGGDFSNPNLDPQIRPLGLSERQKNALVAFMLALTDDRVRWSRAPFDHPELCVSNGYLGGTSRISESHPGSQQGADMMECLPATGSGGSGSPVRAFLGLDALDPGAALRIPIPVVAPVAPATTAGPARSGSTTTASVSAGPSSGAAGAAASGSVSAGGNGSGSAVVPAAAPSGATGTAHGGGGGHAVTTGASSAALTITASGGQGGGASSGGHGHQGGSGAAQGGQGPGGGR